MIIKHYDFCFSHSFSKRGFSTSIPLRVRDEDLDLSDKKNKQKATEPQQEGEVYTQIPRHERYKELIEQLGPESEDIINEILFEEYDLPQLSTYGYKDDEHDSLLSGDSYDREKEIENRRNRYDNYTFDEKLALEKAKQEYNNIISIPGGEDILSNKLKDISIESTIALDELGKDPNNINTEHKADLLGDLFEIYKYGPEKFDADRRLNEYEQILDENNKKNKDKESDDPDKSDGIGPTSYGAGEDPSSSSGNASSSRQRDSLDTQDLLIIIFSSFGALLDFIIEILININ